MPHIIQLRYLAAAAVLMLSTACAVDDDRQAGGFDGSDRTESQADELSEGQAPPPQCDEGDELLCTMVFSQHNGVTTCFYGVRPCEDGLWGSCRAVEDDATPEGEGVR